MVVRRYALIGRGARRDTVQGFVRVKSLESKSVKKYFAERDRAEAESGPGAGAGGNTSKQFRRDDALERYGRKAACVSSAAAGE